MMRISGLSSGMDTEQMINDIMRAERIPVDRVFQQKVRAEWQRDAYRDINTKLLRLRNFAFDLTLQGTYQQNAATSSNEDILTVLATGRAQPGEFEIQVNKLAGAGRVFSQAVEGTSDVKEAFAEFMAGEDVPSSLRFKGSDGKDIEIELKANDSLENVLARINSNKDLGVNAYLDSYTNAAGEEINRVVLSTRATGVGAKIQIAADGGTSDFFREVFGVEADEDGVLAAGSNAELVINGLETERESNSFDLNGVTVNLHETSNATVRIGVRQDTDAVVDKIKEFVELYNELVDELNASIREEMHRDFPPLTPEQRAELSDKEIEQWEEKAKSGLLRSDRLIGNILNEMRMALGGSVQGVEGGNSLAAIGIKTGGWYEYGRLHVDEDKLRAAVEADPDHVRDIFTLNEEGNGQGLARRLTKVLDNGMERISDTAGKAAIPYDQSYLGRQIRNYEERISAMEDRLIRVEQMHWNKFTAMERVLGQLYAQGDWLQQQLMAMLG